MKRLLSIVVCLLLAASAEAQDSVIVLRAPGAAVDIYRDLHCTRVTSTSSTYNEATSSDNTQKINDWLETINGSQTATPATLIIPYGFVAINDTLGVDVSNGVSLPANVAIISGGGWSNGNYPINRTGYNTGAAGLMWTGSTGTPMVALHRWGNVIRCNFYGYAYIAGVTPDASFPATRCQSAILLDDSFGLCGKHEISGVFSGFDSAIRIQSGTNAHADESMFNFCQVHNCLKFVYCDNEQAVGHQFNKIVYHCPVNTQSTIFDVQAGGNWNVNMLNVIGDYGVTILNLGAVSENDGVFNFYGLSIDRSLVVATQAGSGYLRLVKGNSLCSFCVRMIGNIMWANEDLSTDWVNQGGQELVEYVSPTGGLRVNVKMDIWGAPDELNEDYPW